MTESTTGNLNLKRLQAGDPEMMKLFLDEYAPRLYNIAYRMCRNTELAQDTAQEALTLAIEKIHQFRGESKLITWLYKILFYECLRSKKKEQKYLPLIVDYFNSRTRVDPYRIPASTMFYHGSAAEEQVLTDESRRLFWEALERLSPEQRKVILLRDIEGLSTEETAEVLKLTETNVKVRLHRARKRLKKLVQERMQFPHSNFDNPAK